MTQPHTNRVPWRMDLEPQTSTWWVLPSAVLLALALFLLTPIITVPVTLPTTLPLPVTIDLTALPSPSTPALPHRVKPTASRIPARPLLQPPTARLPLTARTLGSTAGPQMELPITYGLASDALTFPIASGETTGLATGIDAGEMVFELTQADTVPRPLSRLAPLYPPRARMRRIEGDVVVEFVVTPQGTVSGAAIVAAQPPDTFEQTALQAVRHWRFEPGLKDGQPVAVRVRQKLTFKLEE